MLLVVVDYSCTEKQLKLSSSFKSTVLQCHPSECPYSMNICHAPLVTISPETGAALDGDHTESTPRGSCLHGRRLDTGWRMAGGLSPSHQRGGAGRWGIAHPPFRVRTSAVATAGARPSRRAAAPSKPAPALVLRMYRLIIRSANTTRMLSSCSLLEIVKG